MLSRHSGGMRARTLLLVAAAVTVTTIVAAASAAGPPADVPADVRADAAADRARHADHPAVAIDDPLAPTLLYAAVVLRSWDLRRAAAWACAERSALARLYAPGSRTGARDVRDLARWRSRGFRVVGLRQQVAALHVRRGSERRLVLGVTERTVGGVAIGHHRRTPLPTSAWVRHRVVLRRVRGRWLVEEVTQPAR